MEWNIKVGKHHEFSESLRTGMSLRVGDCGWGEDLAVLTGWSSHIEEVLMWRRAASVHWFMDIVCGLIYESCLACRTEPHWKPADRSLRKISQNILSKLNYSMGTLPGRRRSMSRQKKKTKGRRRGGKKKLGERTKPIGAEKCSLNERKIMKKRTRG